MSVQTLAEVIRPLKARRDALSAPAPFVSRALAGFEARERVEAQLEARLVELRREIPELLPTRHLFDAARLVFPDRPKLRWLPPAGRNARQPHRRRSHHQRPAAP